MSAYNNTPMKVMMIGDANVGKTSFILRHTLGQFYPEKQVDTIGLVSSEWKLQFGVSGTRITADCGCIKPFTGRFIFNIRDYVGSECPMDAVDVSDGVIIMFDLTRAETYETAKKLYEMIKQTYPHKIVVVCGNKCEDDVSRQVPAKSITIHHRFENVAYYDISARSCYNFEKPFLWLARTFLNIPNLVFVEPQ